MSPMPLMATKTWLEVALNGPWGRDRQPGIPVRTDDIVAQGVACAREGRQSSTCTPMTSQGPARDGGLYARIIEASARR